MQIIRSKKFSEKIFKVFIAISVLPLLLVAYNSINVVIETRKQNIAELQALAIETAGEKIKNFLDKKIETFRLVISAEFSDLAEIDENNLNHLIESVQTTAGDINEISFIDKNGNEIVKRGGIETRQFNIFNNPEYKTTSAGQDYFGPVVHTENGPIIQLAAPVENKDKKIIGTISAIINLEPLKLIINKIKLGDAGFVYAVDDAGYLIASGNSRFAASGDNLKNINLINDVIRGNFHDGLGKNDRYVNSLGQEAIFAGRPMGKVNWFIVSEWPKNDAFSVINNIIKQSLIIIFLSLALTIALALIFTRQIVRPIEALNRGANEIAKGNLDYHLDLKTNDEFEALGEKFNGMIKALNENRKLRDEFVFIAAHELRTPVTAIKGYLSMAFDGSFGKIDAKLEKNLKIVNDANERLVRLVQDLLEVARNESNTLKISLSPLVIGESVKTVASELTQLAKKKKIRIRYDEKLGDKKIKADSYKLKELLINLVGNAVKYTPDGKGDVEISHEEKDGLLITRIKDHGLGIAEEELNKLFTKFHRVKTKETADIEGTGLGLFICKQIAERMGGKIWAESKPGEGSVFSFSLALA